MLLTCRIASAGGVAAAAGRSVRVDDATLIVKPRGEPLDPLPARAERGSRKASSRRFIARLGAGRPGLVFRHIVLGGGLEQRTHLVLHGLDPVGDLHPLGAVPLLHVGGMMSVMVRARHVADRRRKIFEPELLPALGGDFQRLEAAPHVLAGYLLL